MSQAVVMQSPLKLKFGQSYPKVFSDGQSTSKCSPKKSSASSNSSRRKSLSRESSFSVRNTSSEHSSRRSSSKSSKEEEDNVFEVRQGGANKRPSSAVSTKKEGKKNFIKQNKIAASSTTSKMATRSTSSRKSLSPTTSLQSTSFINNKSSSSTPAKTSTLKYKKHLKKESSQIAKTSSMRVNKQVKSSLEPIDSSLVSTKQKATSAPTLLKKHSIPIESKPSQPENKRKMLKKEQPKRQSSRNTEHLSEQPTEGNFSSAEALTTQINDNNKQIADVEDEKYLELLYSIDLSDLHHRSKTFEKWPLHEINSEVLAVNGWYYLGDRDRTQCYYCKLVLCEWKNELDAQYQHKDNCCMKKRKHADGDTETKTLNRFQQATQETIIQQPEEITSTIQQPQEITVISKQPEEITSIEERPVKDERRFQQATIEQQTEKTNEQPSTSYNKQSTSRFQQETNSPLHKQASQVSNSTNNLQQGTENIVIAQQETAELTSRIQQPTEEIATPIQKQSYQPEDDLSTDEEEVISTVNDQHNDSDDIYEDTIDPEVDLYPHEDPVMADIRRSMYPCDQPSSSSMKQLDKRIESFDNWNGEQDFVLDIAEAGFFYIGIDDVCRCWYCGIELKNWYYDQIDPWVLHASTNHSCHYLKRNRNDDFIQEAMNNPQPTLEQYKQAQEAPSTGVLATSPVHLVFSRSVPSFNYVLDERPKEVLDREELEKAMSEEPALQAQQIAGYTRQEVETVLMQQISSNGVAFQTYAGLINAILKWKNQNH